MAFQMGFPKKPNVPHRMIVNKSMGDFQLSGRRGRSDVDNISFSNKKDIGVIQTKKMAEIRSQSPDIYCKDGYK